MRDRDHGSDWHAQETYKGLIQISISALRFGIFSNGGAAVALLAFLGKNISIVELHAAKGAMAFFISGVALGGFAHVTAYLTQLRLYGESALGNPQHGFLRHNNFLYATVVLGVASIVAFAVGSLWGVATLHPVAP